MQYSAIFLFLNHTILSGKEVFRTYNPGSTQFHLLAVFLFKFFSVSALYCPKFAIIYARDLSHSLKRKKQVTFLKSNTKVQLRFKWK